MITVCVLDIHSPTIIDSKILQDDISVIIIYNHNLTNVSDLDSMGYMGYTPSETLVLTQTDLDPEVEESGFDNMSKIRATSFTLYLSNGKQNVRSKIAKDIRKSHSQNICVYRTLDRFDGETTRITKRGISALYTKPRLDQYQIEEFSTYTKLSFVVNIGDNRLISSLETSAEPIDLTSKSGLPPSDLTVIYDYKLPAMPDRATSTIYNFNSLSSRKRDDRAIQATISDNLAEPNSRRFFGVFSRISQFFRRPLN